MTVTPTLSPWPAPTLADSAPHAAPTDTRTSAAEVIELPPQRPIAALLGRARRFTNRAERAEHAALKEEQKIGAELADLPAGGSSCNRSIPTVSITRTLTTSMSTTSRSGPGGVFMIYVEHQPGAKVWVSEHAVTIDGRESNRLRRARFEARRSSRTS